MSKTTGVRHRALIGSVLAVFACFVGGPVQAQTAASVREELAAARDSAIAAQEELKRIREGVTSTADTFFVEHGVRVHYPREGFEESAEVAMRRAVTSARDQLERRFGPTGAALLDGEEWTLSLVTSRAGLSTRIRISWQSDEQGSFVMRTPIAVGELADAIIRRVSRRATALHPAVDRIASGAPVLSDVDAQYRVALRQMTTSRSTPARRCAAGRVSACERVLTEDRTLWFDEQDPQAGNPRAFSVAVPGSLMAFVLELGGAAVLDSLSRGGAEDEDAVTVLAATVGLDGPSLIEQWHTQLRSSNARRAAPSMPLALTSIFWCGLCLVVAGRRRPR